MGCSKGSGLFLLNSLSELIIIFINTTVIVANTQVRKMNHLIESELDVFKNIVTIAERKPAAPNATDEKLGNNDLRFTFPSPFCGTKYYSGIERLNYFMKPSISYHTAYK